MYEISMVGRHKKWNSVTCFTGGVCVCVYVYTHVRSIGLHIYPGYCGECAVNQVSKIVCNVDHTGCGTHPAILVKPGKVCKECGFRENDRVMSGD